MSEPRQGEGPAADTRSRIGDAAATLFRRAGYSGTGLKRISTESGAPFGSIYHFFPGGKQELAEHTIRTAGVAYGHLTLSLLDQAPDPLVALEQAFAHAAIELERTGYADACPIAVIALEVASTNDTLRVATAEVFEGWVDLGSVWFSRWVDDPDTARRLALSLIMLLEGAFLLSRAHRDPEPLRAAGASMVELTRVALAEARLRS